MGPDPHDERGDLPPPAPPSDPGRSGSAGRSAYDRVPPHSLDAEVSVLGAALLSKNAAAEAIELVAPDDFYRSAHRTVFEGVRELFSRGEPIDSVTVIDWLGRHGKLDEVGGAAAIHDLLSQVPTAANAAHYARIVREKSILRKLIDVGTEIVQIGYDGSDDSVAAVDRAEGLVYEVGQTGSNREYSQLKDLLNESFERIEQLAENRSEVTGLATGFNDLDRITAGLQPQNLVIIAARPAMGKSSLAMGLAHYVTAELDKSAIVFSLEMSKQEIVMRLLSSEARIDSSKIRTGRLADSDWRKLGDALGKLSSAPLFIDDTPSITLMEIRSKARRLKQRHGLELVIVDYLQLMTSHRRVDNRQQEVAEFSRGLKMLAKELDVPVIALSQLSRQPETRTDKRPQLSDLRESGCLTRGTRLLRADDGRPITFGQLLDGELRDVPVWSVDDRGRLSAQTLTHAFPSGRKEVFRVRLASGATVEATANHPFLTIDGWRPLGDLPDGARVATARAVPEPLEPDPMDPDELLLLAHLIGEGTTVARQPIHYTSADPANLAAVTKAAFTRFGIEARAEADGRSAVTTQLYLPAPHHLTHGRRNPIARWLTELGAWDRRAHQKRVPGRVFSVGDDQLRFFLRHLWSTDGSITRRRDGARGPRFRIYYATSSPGLAQDVRLLLLRLGIRARISQVPERGGHRDSYHVRVTGAAQQRRFLTHVGAHGERGRHADAWAAELRDVTPNPNVDTIPREIWDRVRTARASRGMTERAFQAAIDTAYCGTTLYRSGLSRERLARVARVLDDVELADLATSDLFWDRIVEVEPIGVRDVYDATVLGTHNFLAEGIVLHNSLEQDADIVGFIYRDEVYNEDSPDRGIAELIVAKHRNGPTGVVKLAFLNHLTKFANLAHGSTQRATPAGSSSAPPQGPTPV